LRITVIREMPISAAVWATVSIGPGEVFCRGIGDGRGASAATTTWTAASKTSGSITKPSPVLAYAIGPRDSGGRNAMPGHGPPVDRRGSRPQQLIRPQARQIGVRTAEVPVNNDRHRQVSRRPAAITALSPPRKASPSAERRSSLTGRARCCDLRCRGGLSHPQTG
jgi:hypothetical protein